MIKRNRLYTVNKWNKPAFMPANRFDLGGSVSGISVTDGIMPNVDLNASAPTSLGDGVNPLAGVSWLKKVGAGGGFGKALNSVNTGMLSSGLGGLAGSVGSAVGKGIGSIFGNGLSTGAGSAIQNVGGTVAGIVGNINPVAGAIAGVGTGLIGGLVNGAFGSKVFGEKEAKENISRLSGTQVSGGSNDAIAQQLASTDFNTNKVTYKDGWFSNKGKRKARQLNQQQQNALAFAENSFDNAIDNVNTETQDSYERNYAALGGPIDIEDMGAIGYGLMTDYLISRNRQSQSKEKSTIPSTLAMNNVFADGGIMIKPSHEGVFTEKAKDAGMGVQEFAEHVLANKEDYPLSTRRQAVFARNARKFNKHSMGGNLFRENDTLFALGGDLQSNGANWGSVTEVNAGGSHEENVHQGVQMGTDREGTPNLVEENEVIYKDYVFSARLKCPKDVRTDLGVKGKKDMSFANVAKKLEDESKERPNDPISQAGLDAAMKDLAQAQEGLKKELEAERAKAEFNALSPEEQTAIMEQRNAQQQAMEQQAAQQQMAAQQPSPEQVAMAQQAQSQGVSPEEAAMQQQAVQQPNVSALGGNLYENGGKKKGALNSFLKALGLVTQGDLDKWAKDNKIDLTRLWTEDALDMDAIKGNRALMDALGKKNPALRDSIDRGYDFGQYVPAKDGKLTFDFQHGGWGKEDYDAWKGSTDAAWKEALEKGLVKEGMKSEEIGKALRQTDAYKRGSKWLSDSEDNRLQYLQAIYNSTDAHEAARKYAAKYVDHNGWLKDAKRDYQTIFEDPNGTGVRNTHPGTYWKTPNEVLRNASAKNFVINNDGSVEEILTDVPTGWKQDSSYAFSDPTSDYTYNYYRRPAAANPDGATTPEGESDDTSGVVPRQRWEGWRYAGLLGPAVGLGMQAMGIGKPDTSGLDAAVSASGVNPIMAGVEHIGDYMRYMPFDRNYYSNKLSAQAGATRRAILNSGSGASRGAQILAADYNAQDKLGDLFRQAEEYNLAQRQKVAEFNRGTNQFNAEADNKALLQYASDYNNQRKYNAQLQMEAARAKMDADAAWNQGIYGNISNLATGLGNLGKENAEWNMIGRMGANGLFGTMDADDNALGSKILKKKAAKGGKLNRKRRGGLTY